MKSTTFSLKKRSPIFLHQLVYPLELFTQNALQINMLSHKMVRVIGLEPTRPKAPEPKSGASTNFATPAFLVINSKINKN